VEMRERFSDSRIGFSQERLFGQGVRTDRNAWASQVTHKNPGLRLVVGTFLEQWLVWFWVARFQLVSLFFQTIALKLHGRESEHGSLQIGMSSHVRRFRCIGSGSKPAGERIQSRIVKFGTVATRWKRSGQCDSLFASPLLAVRRFLGPSRALVLVVVAAR
jgi:hypothetical protein